MTLYQVETKHIARNPDWIIDYEWKKNPLNWKSSKGGLIHYERQVLETENTSFFRIVRLFDSLASVQNYSTLEFNFDPNCQSFQLHSLNIFREGIEIDKLADINLKIIQKESQSHEHIFNGIKTAIIILDDVREGDVLEYSYSFIENNPLYKDNFVDIFYLNFGFEVENIYYRLIGSANLFFKYSQGNFEPTKKSQEGELCEWVWSIQNSSKVKFDSGLPSWFNPQSWIQVSSFKTWAEVSKWAESIFELSSKLSSDICDQVEEWKAAAKDAEDLILKIIRFVQNDIRYLSLDKEIGQYAAAQPNEVFQRRFGDCKDKTLLLHHLFKMIGVESDPVLVSTYLRESILEWHPTPTVFNHAIIRFNFNDNYYWINPTNSFQGGKLSNFSTPNYKYGLIVGNNLSKLEPIPSLNSNRTTLFTVFELDENGSGRMEVVTNYYGSDADDFRFNYKQQSPEKLTSNYKDFYNKCYSQVEVKSAVKIEDQLDKNVISTKEDYRIGILGKRIGNSLVYEYLFFPILVNQWIITDIDLTRSSPLALPYPLEIHEEIHINLPMPLFFEQKFNEIENNYIKFKSKWTKEDHMSVILQYSLSYLTDHVKIEDLESFRKNMEEISTSIKAILTLDFRKDVKKKKSKSTLSKGEYTMIFALIIIVVLHLISL